MDLVAAVREALAQAGILVWRSLTPDPTWPAGSAVAMVGAASDDLVAVYNMPWQEVAGVYAPIPAEWEPALAAFAVERATNPVGTPVLWVRAV